MQVHTFTGIDPSFGGDKDGRVVFRYTDVVDSLVSSLYESAVDHTDDSTFVLHSSKR